MDQASIYRPGTHIPLIGDDPMIGQSLMGAVKDAACPATDPHEWWGKRLSAMLKQVSRPNAAVTGVR
jgi:hypothetical protein